MKDTNELKNQINKTKIQIEKIVELEKKDWKWFQLFYKKLCKRVKWTNHRKKNKVPIQFIYDFQVSKWLF